MRLTVEGLELIVHFSIEDVKLRRELYPQGGGLPRSEVFVVFNKWGAFLRMQPAGLNGPAARLMRDTAQRVVKKFLVEQSKG